MLIVVTGPPAAGKSSWIDAHAKASDIVIDLDRITRALTGPGAPSWNQDPLQLRVAHRARYAAMREAFELRDKTDVYLIHTMPTAKWLARYKRMDAKVIAVDPGRTIVMQRIEAMRDPEMKRVATRWYRSRPATQPGARAGRTMEW
ncbi:AAA family ATPase [Streptomyces sp. NPDC001914]|uniref:AAA family ATPase n=1 Tax=Streptomyces sp. NPDC001914 TaxID=3364623 RepID=UPI0036BC9489